MSISVGPGPTTSSIRGSSSRSRRTFLSARSCRRISFRWFACRPNFFQDGNFEGLLPKDQKVHATGEGKKAPRFLAKGEFLLASDWTGNVKTVDEIIKPKPSQVIFSLPVTPDTNFGKLLQPGTFVTVSGGFGSDTRSKAMSNAMEVIPCIQVRAIDGSFEAIGDKPRAIKTVQIVVSREQALQLQRIRTELRPTQFFTVEPVGQPEKVTDDPVITKEVLQLIKVRDAQKVDEPPSKAGRLCRRRRRRCRRCRCRNLSPVRNLSRLCE